jgi:hypothetical protein
MPHRTHRLTGQKTRRLPKALIALSTLGLLASCYSGGVYGPLGATCPALSAADPLSIRVSQNAVADAKVRTFLAASHDLVAVSVQMENEVLSACRAMAADLGVNPQQMNPSNPSQPGAAAQAACAAVAAQIDAIMRQGLSVRVQASPPQCQANLQAKANCEGVCSAVVDPGRIVAECEPARLSGYCSGTCRGQCDANCQGQCQGQCSAQSTNGQCMGRCVGTCTGNCDGVCHASCQGSWQSPQCQGYVQAPRVDAECNASCNARAEFQASCTPAQVSVTASHNADMVMRLARTLQVNMPLLLHAELALGRRLAQSARVVVSVGSQLPRIVGQAGAQALACIAAASNASVNASMRIDVSIQASASVTGKVGTR